MGRERGKSRTRIANKGRRRCMVWVEGAKEWRWRDGEAAVDRVLREPQQTALRFRGPRQNSEEAT